MVRVVARWVAALSALSFVGVLAGSGCRIQLCKGDGCGGVPDVGGWGGGENAGGSGAYGGGGSGGSVGDYVPTPEEQAAINAAENMDPQVRALNSARAGFVGYALQGLVEEQITSAGLDPGAIDVDTLAQMLQDVAAPAWDATNQWIASLDPSTLATPAHPINVSCLLPPAECKPSVDCDFADICVVDDCGDGKCKPCPEKFGLGNLVISGWCSYVCYKDVNAVGVSVTFRPRIGANIVPWVQLCFAN